MLRNERKLLFLIENIPKGFTSVYFWGDIRMINPLSDTYDVHIWKEEKVESKDKIRIDGKEVSAYTLTRSVLNIVWDRKDITKPRWLWPVSVHFEFSKEATEQEKMSLSHHFGL